MTTILATFIIALFLGLIFTPAATAFGRRFGAIDLPGGRKVHKAPIPRTGGIGLFFAFFITLIISTFFSTDVSHLLVPTRGILFLSAGSSIVFAIGLIDDFQGISARTKLLFQILSANVAFWGGVKINSLSLFGFTLSGFPFSYIMTIFWFILFINALNLVDGLDGLAGGITVFASSVMVVLSIMYKDFFTVILFAALAGSVLGFLRYNFNPASVFLGDAGSYFLGYALAGLSILSSVKSQVGAALLIPMVALGVPVFDTIFSPIRRFLYGKKAFSPDDGHIHHKLKQMGLNTRKAVLFLYGVTIFLCGISLILVNFRNETASLFLVMLGVGMFIFVRKLRYFEYFGYKKIYGWLKDVTDEAGFSRDRRSFLNLQVEINNSKNMNELWMKIGNALETLNFDMAEMYIDESTALISAVLGEDMDSRIDGKLVWTQNGFDGYRDICKECLFKLELPLLGKGNGSFGALWLIKDLKRDGVSHCTLRRIEHLRRSVIMTLEKLQNNAY